MDISLARAGPVSPDGRWLDYSARDKFSSRKYPVFSPQSVDAAKSYIKRDCPPRPPRSPASTPLTSQAPLGSSGRLASSAKNPSTMVCHGCHGIIGDEQHKGSAIGKAKCILPHSSTCPGGILDDDSWRRCPPGYAPGIVMSATGFESTLQYADFLPGTGLGQGSTPVVSDLVPHELLQTGGDVGVEDVVRFYRQANGEGARSRVMQERFPSMFGGSQEDCTITGPAHPLDNFLPSDLVDEVANFRALNQLANQQEVVSTELTIADIRQMPGLRAQAENHMTSFRDVIPALASAPSAAPPGLPLPVAANPVHEQQSETPPLPSDHQSVLHVEGAGNIGSVHDDPGVDDDELQATQAQYEDILRQQAQAFQELERLKLAQREQQQLNAAAVLRQQQAQAEAAKRQRDMLMAQQRAAALQDQRQKLAKAAATLQTTQAALQRQRQFHNPTVRDQPNSVLTHGRHQPDGGIQAPHHAQSLGRVQSRPAPVLGGQQPLPAYDYFVGPDGLMCRVPKTPPAPVPVPQAYRWENRWSPATGRMYQVQAPILPPPSPAPSTSRSHQQTWKFDPMTGLPCTQAARETRSFPQTQQQQQAPHHSVIFPSQPLHHQTVSPSQPLHQHHNLTGGVFPHQGAVSSAAVDDSSMNGQIREKLKGIVSLVEKGDGLKQMKLIDHIKRCPTKWSKDVSAQNMNLPVFAYGATSELVASLSGRAEPVPESVLLAKLEHMKNVFEICCQNSTQLEYSNYGWVLARDYACKVQNKVDQQLVDWQSMPSGVQTADLVSAQCEYPRPAPPGAKVVKEKEEAPAKRTCSTYNTSSVEKKCDYEVQNPGKYCQRKHECSYCRKHLNKGIKHQVWKCPSKSDN